MKPKTSKDVFLALHTDPILTPLHQTELRAAILSQGFPERSLAKSIVAAPRRTIEYATEHKARTFGISSVLLSILLVVALTTYSLDFSPHAYAEQTIDQGIGSIQSFSPETLASVKAHIGGDPLKALETAEAAKDVHVITEAQYQAELAAHTSGMVAVLGYGSPGTTSAESVSISNIPASGTESSGNASFSSSGQTTVTAGPDGATLVTTSTSDGPVPTPPAGSSGYVAYTSGGGHGMDTSGPVLVTAGSGTIANGAAVTALPSSATPPNLAPTMIATPSKFLQYTNSEGQTVILALDAHGVPISETMLITHDATTSTLP